MTSRATIDASVLPAAARDTRSPSWWGNTLFMCIETSTVCLVLASYFYLWRNYPQEHWPPPRVDQEPTILKPVPDLLIGTLNVLLLVATVPLARWVDWFCCKRFDELEQLNVSKPSQAPPEKRPEERPRPVIGGLLAMTFLGAVALVLRWYEFPALQVRWNENAYAGMVWTLLGLHFLYIFIEVIEYAVMALWVWIFGLGENQSGDVILTCAYWYWTVAVGVVIYFVVYWFPRVV
jgi:cytochrome c oxidase subunit 3